MSENRGGRLRTRREVVRRHRRERQVVVFGLLLILLSAVSVGAAAVYRGEAQGPFDSTFKTSAADFSSDITLVCPPASTLPLDPSTVVVRVLNGTSTSGLAGDVESDLSGRSYVTVGAANYALTYDGVVKILFGSDGIAAAYTLARNFVEAELVLDNRTGPTVDVVVGTGYDPATSLRSASSAELDPDRDLYTDEPCLPWTQIVAQQAPRTLPDNPLATDEPTTSATPSPSAS
ncbi:LytR C-terminal domain-containing protein [Demequina capsici]|uniref:LytR C-terminal domain-containing protein n=1 Tax=Demequina capsici TaxID=3075620 RepID=A0AA96F6K3_9MICO|nr:MULTISPECIES: LytR C-terminal domain-containing protein [unclassified Demequina]WNM24259.1 LytR C-terminal domain-containing protein [Demequina sp. OYTSA14]WNM27088.1 LytR C-terminal domain-containing protein [Demequina sp. PMTSA13]